MSGIGFGTPIEPPGGAGTSTLDTARRGSRRRNAIISTVSTVVFFAIIIAAIARVWRPSARDRMQTSRGS